MRNPDILGWMPEVIIKATLFTLSLGIYLISILFRPAVVMNSGLCIQFTEMKYIKTIEILNIRIILANNISYVEASYELRIMGRNKFLSNMTSLLLRCQDAKCELHKAGHRS